MKNVPKKAPGARKIRLQGVQAPVGRVRDAGSTILAVLVALVFIGIVVASMLRNTGSQSGASVGYGAVQSAAVTAASGIIATESFFHANAGGAALTRLNEYLAAGDADKDARSFVIGGAGQKQKIDKESFFSSRITSYDRVQSRTAGFEIKGGRAEKGRNLKTARAFYRVENGRITGETTFPGSNAFSATENARMPNANGGMRIFGHATFTDGFKIQNQDNVEFLPDENDTGSLYISGQASIGNTARVNIGVNAFFDGDVTIQNITNNPNTEPLFAKNVGFNGNISASNRTIGFGGDVWFNGTFHNDGNSVLKGDSVNTKFYYTSTIPMKTTAMCGICDNGGTCPHGCNSHTVIQSDRIKGFINMHKDSTSGYFGANIPNIPQKVGITTLEQRREPDISMGNLTGVDKAGKTFLDAADNNVLSYNSLTGAGLQAFYDRTSNDPDYAQYYHNGHLLIRIPPSGVACGGGEFNGKVIFNVEGNFNVNTNFYTSNPANSDASTLVYVGSSGALQNFGVGNNGNFSGLIYVDKNNTKDNTFKWGNNTTLNGAVILKGGTLTWNSGSNYTEIHRDNNVLKNYGFLIDGADVDNEQVELVDDSRGLILRPTAYYFY